MSHLSDLVRIDAPARIKRLLLPPIWPGVAAAFLTNVWQTKKKTQDAQVLETVSREHPSVSDLILIKISLLFSVAV